MIFIAIHMSKHIKPIAYNIAQDLRAKEKSNLLFDFSKYLVRLSYILYSLNKLFSHIDDVCDRKLQLTQKYGKYILLFWQYQ